MISEEEMELDCLRRAITRERSWNPDLQLSRGQARMLALLYKREAVRPEALAATYGGDPTNTASIRVGVSRLRGKLPLGVGIVAEHNLYRLTGKERLTEHIVRI